MKYTNLIKLFNKFTVSTHILIKLNLWSFFNLKNFLFKASSFLFYFLTNLPVFKLKFIKVNNYTNFNVYVLISVVLVFIILLSLL